MDMGHLYHDAVLGDPILALDVKEQLRTREINASEEQNFLRKSQTYDRAIDLAERTANWEKGRLQHTLGAIMQRSPHLEHSLAIERARLEAFHATFLRRAAASQTRRGQQASHGAAGAAAAARANSPSKRPVTRKGRSALKSIGRRRRQDREKSKKKSSKEEGPPLNTDVGLDRLKTTIYARRNQHAVKKLARVGYQMESRRRDHRRFQENLVHFSKPLVEKARMVLQGRHDINVERFLKEFEEFLMPNEEKAEGKVVSHRAAASQQRRVGSPPLSSNANSSSQPEEDTGFLPLISAASGVASRQDQQTISRSQDSPGASGGDSLSHPVVVGDASKDAVDSSSAPSDMTKELALRLQDLSMTLSRNSTGEQDEKASLGGAASSSPSKSRPGSEREGSFHLPAIVATKSDVMNLRSRPGSSAGPVAQSPAAISTEPADERPKVSESGDSANNVHGFRLKPVDLNNNEYQSSTSIDLNKVPNTDPRNGRSTDGGSNKNVKTDVQKGESSNERASHGKGKICQTAAKGNVETNNSMDGSNKTKHTTKEKDIPSKGAGNTGMAKTSGEENDKKEYDISARKSASRSAVLSATPSTILSQVILEEDEIEHGTGSHGTSHFSTSPSQQRDKPFSRETREFNDLSRDKQASRLPALSVSSRTHNERYNYPNRSVSPLRGGSEGHGNTTRDPRDRDTGMRSRREDPFHARETPRSRVRDETRLSVEDRGITHHNNSSTAASLPHKKDPFHASYGRHHTSENRGGFRDQSDPRDTFHHNLRRSMPARDESLDSFNIKGNLHRSTAGVSREDYNDNDKDGADNDDKNAYKMTCTIGLPKLWKQGVDQKKDSKSSPEVSAAAMARKHRRNRMNSQPMF